MKKKPRYFIGLDLGQLQDYTALTVVKKVFEDVDVKKPDRYNGYVIGYSYEKKTVFKQYELQHLHRFDLRTPYAQIAETVKDIQRRIRDGNTYVVADATGVGRPVLEMLEEAGVKEVYGITITGGNSVNVIRSKDVHVPKRDLVSSISVLLQSRKLKFAEGLPFGDVLKAELQNFKAKINIATGNDTYEAWRESQHDDLVLSLALACWFGENREPDDWSEIRALYSAGQRL